MAGIFTHFEREWHPETQSYGTYWWRGYDDDEAPVIRAKTHGCDCCSHEVTLVPRSLESIAEVDEHIALLTKAIKEACEVKALLKKGVK